MTRFVHAQKWYALPADAARPVRLRGRDRFRIPVVAEPAQQPPASDPVVDPDAIRRAYRRQRAKRMAREQRHRERRHADLRFWAVVLVLLGLSFFVGLTVWHEIQHLFGL